MMKATPALFRAALLPVALVLPGAAVLCIPAMADASGRSVETHPVSAVLEPGDSSILSGVFCTSASNCWAIGQYDVPVGTSASSSLNQALHWNGRKWSKATTPNPGGTAKFDVSALEGIWCTSPGDCWAVGSDAKYRELGSNEALHWNGQRWAAAATPQPGGTADSHFLNSVSCASASDCWAAGDYLVNNGDESRSQVLHWNGRRWSKVAAPSPGGTAAGDSSNLYAAWCVSGRSCWAVGAAASSNGSVRTSLNLALHWNGRRWHDMSTPDPGGTGGGFNELNGVSCVSASNCWAVGDYQPSSSPDTRFNQALHWNGRKWSLVATPDPDGTGAGADNTLNGVYCGSAVSCWAVGRYGSIRGGVGSSLNQVLHWDGGTWSLVAAPNPGGTANNDSNLLDAVGCVTARSCWTVGLIRAKDGTGPDVNQALRWNGRSWAVG